MACYPWLSLCRVVVMKFTSSGLHTIWGMIPARHSSCTLCCYMKKLGSSAWSPTINFLLQWIWLDGITVLVSISVFLCETMSGAYVNGIAACRARKIWTSLVVFKIMHVSSSKDHLSSALCLAKQADTVSDTLSLYTYSDVCLVHTHEWKVPYILYVEHISLWKVPVA